MLNKEPYGSKIIVLTLDAKEVKSSGGILLDGDSVPIGVEGLIKAVGPECKQARVGRKAIYPMNSGFDIFIDGVKYRSLSEYDVIYFDASEEDIYGGEDRVFNVRE